VVADIDVKVVLVGARGVLAAAIADLEAARAGVLFVVEDLAGTKAERESGVSWSGRGRPWQVERSVDLSPQSECGGSPWPWKRRKKRMADGRVS
jgi:hypothetical protein